MANYKKIELENFENVFVEQNIYNNNELTSYTPTVESVEYGVRETVLCAYRNEEGVFYKLGFRSDAEGSNMEVVVCDMTDVLSFKRAIARRKRILKAIEQHEQMRVEASSTEDVDVVYQEVINLVGLLKDADKPLKRVWYKEVKQLVKTGQFKRFYHVENRGFASSQAYIVTVDDELLHMYHDVNDVNTSYLINFMLHEMPILEENLTRLYSDEVSTLLKYTKQKTWKLKEDYYIHYLDKTVTSGHTVLVEGVTFADKDEHREGWMFKVNVDDVTEWWDSEMLGRFVS